MAASFQVSAPEPFSFTHPNEWPKWIRRFERFRVASGLIKDDKIQVNTLIYSMGDLADELTAEESTTYLTVKELFDSHFVKRRNVIYARAKCRRR